MTFSRAYAKARKAALKQHESVRINEPHVQARRHLDPESESAVAPGRSSWAWLLKCLGVVLFLAILGSAWFFRSNLLLPIRAIHIEGQVTKVDQHLLQAALSAEVHRSMFASTRPLEQRLMALPWVDHVVIVRQWPNALLIQLTEIQPVARFNEGLAITREGLVVKPPSVDALSALPLLVGPPDKALFLWQAYQQMNAVVQSLGLKIWQLSLSPRFAYQVVLNNGLTLYLGVSQITERLQLFVRVYQQQLAAKVEQMAYVDLRYPSSLAIGWKPVVPSAPVTP